MLLLASYSCCCFCCCLVASASCRCCCWLQLLLLWLLLLLLRLLGWLCVAMCWLCWGRIGGRCWHSPFPLAMACCDSRPGFCCLKSPSVVSWPSFRHPPLGHKYYIYIYACVTWDWQLCYSLPTFTPFSSLPDVFLWQSAQSTAPPRGAAADAAGELHGDLFLRWLQHSNRGDGSPRTFAFPFRELRWGAPIAPFVVRPGAPEYVASCD